MKKKILNVLFGFTIISADILVDFIKLLIIIQIPTFSTFLNIIFIFLKVKCTYAVKSSEFLQCKHTKNSLIIM